MKQRVGENVDLHRNLKVKPMLPYLLVDDLPKNLCKKEGNFSSLCTNLPKERQNVGVDQSEEGLKPEL